MGSHGGATDEGQRETLASLGITPRARRLRIRSSMDVETVGTDSTGQPVYAAMDALAADAVLLANRVKLHTDFQADVESGLAKMAVVGLGKQRGAENMHNAALDRGFTDVIPERAEILVDETPIVGGLALVENADERAAAVEGVPADDLLEAEPALLDRSEALFPSLPIEDLDLLVVDEMGKEVSGTGTRYQRRRPRSVPRAGRAGDPVDNPRVRPLADAAVPRQRPRDGAGRPGARGTSRRPSTSATPT